MVPGFMKLSQDDQIVLLKAGKWLESRSPSEFELEYKGTSTSRLDQLHSTSALFKMERGSRSIFLLLMAAESFANFIGFIFSLIIEGRIQPFSFEHICILSDHP